MKKVIEGVVTHGKIDWSFETGDESYSDNVCAAMDEILGFDTRDGEKVKITIEFEEK